MKCFYCRGKMEADTTTDFTDLKTCIIVIKNVPCHKCTQCGEVSFDFAVGERLEQIINEFRESTTEITVIHYASNAA